MYVGTFAQGGSAAIALLYAEESVYRERGPEILASLEDHDILAEMLKAVQIDADTVLVDFGVPEIIALAHSAYLGFGTESCRVATASGETATVKVTAIAGIGIEDEEGGDEDDGELGVQSIRIIKD